MMGPLYYLHVWTGIRFHVMRRLRYFLLVCAKSASSSAQRAGSLFRASLRRACPFRPIAIVGSLKVHPDLRRRSQDFGKIERRLRRHAVLDERLFRARALVQL